MLVSISIDLPHSFGNYWLEKKCQVCLDCSQLNVLFLFGPGCDFSVSGVRHPCQSRSVPTAGWLCLTTVIHMGWVYSMLDSWGNDVRNQKQKSRNTPRMLNGGAGKCEESQRGPGDYGSVLDWLKLQDREQARHLGCSSLLFWDCDKALRPWATWGSESCFQLTPPGVYYDWRKVEQKLRARLGISRWGRDLGGALLPDLMLKTNFDEIHMF